MKKLLKQEHGNLRNTLAAYNAGPGNVKAGLGYADQILGASGERNGTTITTSGPGGLLGGLGGLAGGLSISGILGNALGDLRDVFERLGLILFGAALILLGIHMLSGGSGTTIINQTGGSSSGGSKSSSSKGSSPIGKTSAGAVEKTGAEKAVEAAAVA